MYLKQYLEDNSISIYKVANSAQVAYPTVFNIVNGKVDILNCALGVVKKIEKDVDKLIDKSIRILYNMHQILSGRGARIFFGNIYTLAYI